MQSQIRKFFCKFWNKFAIKKGNAFKEQRYFKKTYPKILCERVQTKDDKASSGIKKINCSIKLQRQNHYGNKMNNVRIIENLNNSFSFKRNHNVINSVLFHCSFSLLEHHQQWNSKWWFKREKCILWTDNRKTEPRILLRALLPTLMTKIPHSVDAWPVKIHGIATRETFWEGSPDGKKC